MPYRFSFESAKKIFLVSFDGVIYDEEMRKYYFQDIRKLVGRVSLKSSIVDFSRVASFDITSGLVTEMAAYKPVLSDSTIPIFIVAPAPYIFGTSRMFQILGGRTRPMLQVVRSMEEAYERLDVVEPHFEPVFEDE